jgi:predicted phosphodiesterase
MKILDYEFDCKGRGDSFRLYPLGDIHIGARDCAEQHFRRFVNKIASDPNARWIGGGDYLENIKPQDVRRWEFSNLPDWMLKGKPQDIREAMADIVRAQKKRFLDIVQPIKKRCIGLIEGNHEHSIKHYYNQDIQGDLCDGIETQDLTTEAFIRIRFKRDKGVRTIILAICHGHGGGRSAGSEPNHLARLAGYFNADIVLRGHSHQFAILPTQVRVGIPNCGELPEELIQFEQRAANWGCWVKSYSAGPSTYTSRALYQPRPLNTVEIEIIPHRGSEPVIVMREANP